MTEHEFRLKRANLVAELETAEQLGCRRVIADCKHRLQELETERFKEPKRGHRYVGPDFDAVISDDSLLPTMKFIVTFDTGGKAEMFIYRKPGIGLRREDIERDFMDEFNKVKAADAPKIVKCHVLLLRGGRKTPFELACQHINDRFEAMQMVENRREI